MNAFRWFLLVLSIFATNAFAKDYSVWCDASSYFGDDPYRFAKLWNMSLSKWHSSIPSLSDADSRKLFDDENSGNKKVMERALNSNEYAIRESKILLMSLYASFLNDDVEIINGYLNILYLIPIYLGKAHLISRLQEDGLISTPSAPEPPDLSYEELKQGPSNERVEFYINKSLVVPHQYMTNPTLSILQRHISKCFLPSLLVEQSGES